MSVANYYSCPTNVSFFNTTTCNSCQSNIDTFSIPWNVTEGRWYIHSHFMLGFINFLYWRSVSITFLIAYILESFEAVGGLVMCSSSDDVWSNKETSIDSLLLDPGAAGIGIALAVLCVFIMGKKGDITYMRLLQGRGRALFLRLLVYAITVWGVMSFPVFVSYWVSLETSHVVEWVLLWVCYTVPLFTLTVGSAALANKSPSMSHAEFARAFLERWWIVPVVNTVFWVLAIPPIAEKLKYTLVSLAVSVGGAFATAGLCFWFYYRNTSELKPLTIESIVGVKPASSQWMF